MNISQTLLRLGVFILLALPVLQCQTAGSTPATGVKKPVNVAPKKPVAPAVNQAPNTPAPAIAGSQSDGSKPNAAKATTAQLENARLDAMDSDYASMSLTTCVPDKPDPHQTVCNGKAYQVKVSDLALRAKLKQFHVGDHLRVELNEIDQKDELKDLLGAASASTEGISMACRSMVLAACALLLLGFATLVTRGAPLKFIVGMDNRYSNSKFQLALWFWVAMSTYLAVVVFRVWYAGWDFLGGVNIPQHLLELSGLSAITYGGAKAITTAKVDAAAHPVARPGAVVAPAVNNDPKHARQAGQERFFTDLLQNDENHFDFGDFQMLVVTIIAVGMYLSLIFNFLGSIEFLKNMTLPDVDTTILAGFGIGQGAYLAKKAGGDPGTS